MTEPQGQLEAQQAIQDMIARHAPLQATLSAICRMIEQRIPEALCSIMLLDPEQQVLNFAAGDSFSINYREAMQGIELGPNIGACGAAAYHRKLIISPDILGDPNWRIAKPAVEQEGLRACWSAPVTGSSQELLGTFSTYYREPRSPSKDHKQEIQRAVGLVSLAIERHADRKALDETEQRYQSLFTRHPDAVYEFDLNGNFRSGNAALSRMTGFNLEEVIGKHFLEFVVEEDRKLAANAFHLACRGEPQHYEVAAINAEGRRYNLEVTNLPIVINDDVVGVYGIARDVTLRKQYEAELRLLERGVEASINGVVIADANLPDMPLVYVNKTFLEITGYTREEVLGRNVRFLQGPGTDPDAVSQIRQALKNKTDIQLTMRNYRKEGTAFWNHMFIGPVLDEHGNCTHFIGIQHDVSQHKAYEEQLEFHETHDMLTGVLNRPPFELRLRHDYQLCQQRSALLAVLFIDLDGFRQINEGMGHEVGDRLLIAAAHRLQNLMDPGDTLARVSSDEFVVLLPSAADEDKVLTKTEQLLEALSRPFEINEHLLHISGSVGIASNSDPINSPDELVHRAEMAMQQAKQQGRNTWQWYRDDGSTPDAESVALRREMNDAIRQELFELHYQPIVAAGTQRIRKIEALVRWRHPEKGLVPPNMFIPLAEQTGQIIAIGRWVLWRACRDAVLLQKLGTPEFTVAVNISPLQFRRDGFLDEVRRVLQETGLPAHQLELEVTEGVLLSGTDRAIETLRSLHKMGVHVSIDDFGTGFSSLRYLRQLPIQTVKLDRSFIHDITTNRDSAAIVQGVITMAHHLNLQVVAEGIETDDQRQDLSTRGCDLLQGFYFARPMPIDDLERIFSEKLPL